MSRSMRRARLALDERECEEILKRGKYGVLAVQGDEGYPYTVPLNYVFVDGAIYFHSAKEGHKIDAITREAKASFCVVDKSAVVPELFATAYKSVIAFGRASFVDDGEEKTAVLHTFIDRFAPGRQEAGERFIHGAYEKTQIIRIDVEQITGKAYRSGSKWD